MSLRGAGKPSLFALAAVLVLAPAAAFPWMAAPDAAPGNATQAFTRAPRGSDGPATAAAGDPIFATPVELPDSTGFAEPSIAAAPDGTLYVVAPGTGTWRSDDLGVSWIRVANTLGDGGDADVAVDLDGVVYASDLNGNAPVSVSFDRGATYDYVTDTNGDGNLDRQWLAVAGHGHVFATVRAGNAETIAVSHDQGQTFTSPLTIDANGSTRGNILATSEQDLYIPYSNGDLRLAISHDGGATWTRRVVANPVGADCVFPAVAKDAAGTLYVTWCEEGGVAFPSTGVAQILVAASGDDGVTWTPPVLLSDDALFNTYPWIVAGDAGRVMVAWYEGVPSIPDPLPLRAAGTAFHVDWHVEVAWSTSADQPSPAWQRMAATGVTHSGPISHELGGLLDFFEATEMPGGNLAITYAGGNGLLPNGATLPQGGLDLTATLFTVMQTGGTNLRAA